MPKAQKCEAMQCIWGSVSTSVLIRWEDELSGGESGYYIKGLICHTQKFGLVHGIVYANENECCAVVRIKLDWSLQTDV